MRSLLFLAFLGCSCGDDVPSGPARIHGASLRLLIQPLGEVDPAYVDSVVAAIEREHEAVVHMAEPTDLPVPACTTVRVPRYRADSLIAWLRSIKPDTIDIIVGITEKDISITKHNADGTIKEPISRYRDFGIFGLGYIGGPSCVVSTFRLGDGHSPRFFDRMKKVAVHEVGHDRSLPHCLESLCVMRDAVERISSIDAAGAGFCAECKGRLRSSRSPSARSRSASAGS